MISVKFVKAFRGTLIIRGRYYDVLLHDGDAGHDIKVSFSAPVSNFHFCQTNNYRFIRYLEV